MNLIFFLDRLKKVLSEKVPRLKTLNKSFSKLQPVFTQVLDRHCEVVETQNPFGVGWRLGPRGGNILRLPLRSDETRPTYSFMDVS